MMKKGLFLVVWIISIMVVFAQQSVSLNSSTSSASFAKMKSGIKKYTYKIIDSQNTTFGYEIYADKKVMIKQLTIPGRQGNEGFKTKKQAEFIAKVVVDKIKKGIMPPTITNEELIKVGI
ncbi:MAG: hypothetical protein RJA07_2779 [Bacteroidota bacterium]|jgi:hypothetical protein